MQTELKYRLRDKSGHPTDTWADITPEIIRSRLQYDEIVKVRHAIAYNMRQAGCTWVEIGYTLNRSTNSVLAGARKADMSLVEVVKTIEL